MVSQGIGFALGAAVLFGLSAPAAKMLLSAVDPWMLAGLLYLGSGIGLGAVIIGRRAVAGASAHAGLGLRDAPPLLVAMISGGVIGPVLLMSGLALNAASRAALLLNLEAVFTALLAWIVFREHVDARIALGMALIALGGAALAWSPGGLTLGRGAPLIVGACLAWSVDNNVTRKVSARDPLQIAALKGSIAGAVNVLLALARGSPWPPVGTTVLAGVVGLLGYGASLVLFALALRRLGTGRTSAYFSTAPFVGALGGIAILREPVTVPLAMAAALMGVGVWLHLTERHEHEHAHEGGLYHIHPHYPDVDHRHGH
jgi:drug/metabolite transporter (DMT)-like permease